MHAAALSALLTVPFILPVRAIALSRDFPVIHQLCCSATAAEGMADIVLRALAAAV